MSFRLGLPIQPSWQNVDLLRVAILNCLSAVFGDRELGESVGIVTSELLENAIKYGDWSPGNSRPLAVTVVGGGGEVNIEVASPIAAGSTHLERIDGLLAWIRRFPTARDAYIARMEAIAEEPDKTGESRMGLVRIAYEGPCSIEAEAEGGLLRVKATIRTSAEPA